jgi:hypothetical protein
MRQAAALVVVGALLSGPAAMLVVSVVAPQPAWNGVAAFAASYHRIQAIPFLLGFLLLAGFVQFVSVCHAHAEGGLQRRTTAALVFTAVYAALVFTNYMLQVGYVPRMLTQGADHLAMLTMAHPSSLAWFLEMFGYGALGVAMWLVADGFGGSRRGTSVRWLLRADAITSVAGAVFTALADRWVFSRSGFASFAVWNALILVCFGLIALSDDRALQEARAR